MFRFPYRQPAVVFLMLCGASALAVDTGSNDDFLPVNEAFSYDVAANADDALTIT